VAKVTRERGALARNRPVHRCVHGAPVVAPKSAASATFSAAPKPICTGGRILSTGNQMKITSILILVIVFGSARPFAQQRDETAEQLRDANRKITIGLVLMGAGALAAPLTALARREGDPGGPVMNVSIGLIAVGSGLTWWGTTQRRRAVQPQTMIGVDVGRTLGFRFRRVW
jgi:hypothetical protein